MHLVVAVGSGGRGGGGGGGGGRSRYPIGTYARCDFFDVSNIFLKYAYPQEPKRWCI